MSSLLHGSGRPAHAAAPTAVHVPLDVAPMATVRLHSDSLAPEAVTSVLGPADAAGRKGDVLRTTRTGREVRAKTGTWYVSTPRHLHSSDPAEHLRWVIDLVAGGIGAIEGAMPGVAVDFSLMVTGDAADAQPLLAAPTPALEAEIRRARAIGTLMLEIPSSGWVKTLGRTGHPPRPAAP